MTRPPAAAGPPTRLRELDLLRFAAVGFVVLHHFAGVRSTVWAGRDAQKIYPELADVAHFGYLGVQLVFMISGFVILMSAWGRNAGDFAVARVVRLYPAYWVSVLLSLTLYLACGAAVPYGDGADPVRRVLPNLTMLQDGMHVAPLEVVYWALWVELHFYVLIALFARVGITYARCVTFMVSWLIIGAFAKEGGSRMLQDVVLPETAPFFIAGMAFFLLHRFGSNIALWLVVAASWALSVHYLVEGVSPLNAWKGVHEIVIPVVVTVFYAVMALAAFGRLSWLRWRLFTVLGGLAYPLYLLHETVARAIVKVFFPHPFLDRWTILPVIVAAAVASAAAVHWLVERPVQALMRPRLAAAMAQIRGGGARPAGPPARPEPDGPPDEGERARLDAPAVPPASVP
ncbi:acyltransferase family protein [Actinomadura chibensis]|uniref:Acyltransferase n=1 Tax=Actinomadura chibensis TaxID=392828 RepID=A0A5D0N9A4_9ACTN|nr:acyltransferase [Actinomadura chibensis]TYB40901.1 acyltransferase [Actinomadura chibensis]